MDAKERIEAATGILEYLRVNYENITISDTTQVLKIAQSAVHQNDEKEFAPPIL